MNDTLDISLAQCNFLVGDIEGNTRKIIETAKYARDHLHADLVVFSELSLTGYPLEDLLFHPAILPAVSHSLEKIKSEINGIYILLGAPTKEGEYLFNSAFVIRDTEILAIYHKRILPNYEVFDEVRYFQAGTATCVVDISGVKAGITICEDIWSDVPIRETVEAGAELIININASPYQVGKTAERTRVLKTRIDEQNVPIIYVNQVGGQDELVFDGESICLDRQGGLCMLAPAFVTGAFTVQYSRVQTDLLESSCLHSPLPELASIYQAILLGVRDYVQKNHFEGVVLGLSGGIDSALTLVLAVDALGSDRVQAVMMPFRYTSDMSVEDATRLANQLDVKLDVIPIDNIYTTVACSLQPVLPDSEDGITGENIQSRIRGLLLMALSNKTGKMLLTTGNKSEMSVGYATLYGDMAGGFAPLKDVSKSLVYQLARYRNQLGAVIPERVLTRAPSAELAPGQVDQDSLPSYDLLDSVLQKFVEQDLTVDQIVAGGYERDLVERIAEMVIRNEYKRRQAPPGVKITRRAFGKDRRFPITSGYSMRGHTSQDQLQ